jgi:serine/threonine protein kinase
VFKPLPTGPLTEKYETLELLGYGGFADVYQAKRKQDGLLVALKLPRVSPQQTVDLEGILREAETWIKLNHRNIVKVYEYGVKPVPWIAMEYMARGSLRQRIKNLDLAATLSIVLQVADALYYAHHYGVVHRDIKPENILFDAEDTPKVSDWGLGKLMLEATGSSSGGMGTLLYSAPEQISKSGFGETDWRTDVYQLGVVMYEMVTGQLPYRGESWEETLSRIKEGKPRMPRELNPSISPELEQIVLKAMQRLKEDRYQDVLLFKMDVEKLMETGI